MSSLTMHTATVPTCIRALKSLAAILEKAAAHAEARKINPAVLLGTRLFPDMLPLAMQIHIANDIAQGGAARLAGAPVPTFEAKERSFAEWIAASQRNHRLPRIAAAGAIRGIRRQDHHVAVALIHEEHAGHRLPVQSCVAERVLSRRDRL